MIFATALDAARHGWPGQLRGHLAQIGIHAILADYARIWTAYVREQARRYGTPEPSPGEIPAYVVNPSRLTAAEVAAGAPLVQALLQSYRQQAAVGGRVWTAEDERKNTDKARDAITRRLKTRGDGQIQTTVWAGPGGGLLRGGLVDGGLPAIRPAGLQEDSDGRIIPAIPELTFRPPIQARPQLSRGVGMGDAEAPGMLDRLRSWIPSFTTTDQPQTSGPRRITINPSSSNDNNTYTTPAPGDTGDNMNGTQPQIGNPFDPAAALGVFAQLGGLMSFLGTRLGKRARIEHNHACPSMEQRREVWCEVLEGTADVAATGSIVATVAADIFGNATTPTSKLFDMNGTLNSRYDDTVFHGLYIVPKVSIYHDAALAATNDYFDFEGQERAVEAALLTYGLGFLKDGAGSDWGAMPLPLEHYTRLNADGSFKSIGGFTASAQKKGYGKIVNPTDSAVGAGWIASIPEVVAKVDVDVKVQLFCYVEFEGSLGMNQGS